MAHTTHRLSAPRAPLGAPHRLPLGAHVLSPATPVAPRVPWKCGGVASRACSPVMCCQSCVCRWLRAWCCSIWLCAGMCRSPMCVHVVGQSLPAGQPNPGSPPAVLQGVDSCGTACVCLSLWGWSLWPCSAELWWVCGVCMSASKGAVVARWRHSRLPGVGRDAAHMHLRGARCLQHAWAPPCPAWSTG